MASYQCRGKNRLWSVRFTLAEDGQEVQKRLSGFARKKDAEMAYLKFMDEYRESLKKVKSDKDITERRFDDIYHEFMTYKQPKVKDSSLYDVTKLFERHILPFFGHLKINQISKKVVLDWQNSLSKYSYKTKCNYRTCLYSMFRYLNTYYDVDNVVAKVETFTKPIEHKEMEIWSKQEFDSFIDTFNDDEILLKTFFSFLYFTGCRLGEALAINYGDVNFKELSVKINKSVTHKTTTKTEYGRYSLTSPKNNSSYRTILLPNALIDSLKSYIEKLPSAKDAKFLFGGQVPLDDHLIYRSLKKHIEKAEVKKIRVHDFRHSHASLLIENGASIVLVAKRLGHSKTEQTLNTYAHLFPNSERALLDKLNQLYV